VRPGEIVGLLGENGAGKSTLMKVIRGIEPHDEGSVTYRGEEIRPGDHLRSRSLGVAMVHQELSLVGPLSVWENIALAEGGPLRRRRTLELIKETSSTFSLGLAAVADQPVESLSLAVRQRIEITKCLITRPSLILLDEPTAILSREEADHLFTIVRQLVAGARVAVVISNHRLDEILAVTERVVVLRSGSVTADLATSETTREALAREMIGAELTSLATASTAIGLSSAGAPERLVSREEDDPAEDGSDGEVLRIEGLRLSRPNGAPALDGLSLSVAAGEIVGIAGVEGNGQTELVDVLASRRRPESGRVVLSTPRQRAPGEPGNRIGVVPADRQRHGCVPAMSVAENLILGDLRAARRQYLVSRRKLRTRAEALIREFGIRCDGPDAPFWSLSGGHQQRAVLARELSKRPAVLVADQPTRGLDVVAVDAVWWRLRQAALEGLGVLVVSSDLVEIYQLAHRVLVISRGRITGEFPVGELDVERLGLLVGDSATDELGETPASVR
jgi:simple sugar transport system ATP-binding protein